MKIAAKLDPVSTLQWSPLFFDSYIHSSLFILKQKQAPPFQKDLSALLFMKKDTVSGNKIYTDFYHVGGVVL